jgi:glycosyltransferase involved in cell wall biosynthesis
MLGSDAMTVSVLMPVYNQERYVAQAIESVFNQTFDSWELIMFNDGSTDKSHEIISRYVPPDGDRVHYVNSSKNMGISYGLNYMLDNMVSGKYYILCAPDDALIRNALEIMWKAIEAESDATAALYGPSHIIDEKGEPSTTLDPYNNEVGIIGTIPYNPYLSCTVNAAACIVKMEYLARIKEKYGYIYDTRLKSSMDWDLWIRLAKMGEIKIYEGNPLSYYRIHSKSMSSQKTHEDAVNEVARRLTMNEYRLPNPNITAITLSERAKSSTAYGADVYSLVHPEGDERGNQNPRFGEAQTLTPLRG